jgi:hypothetical protein
VRNPYQQKFLLYDNGEASKYIFQHFTPSNYVSVSQTGF